MKRLSPTQRKAMLALEQHPRESAYRLRVNLATLQALVVRDLACCLNSGALGSAFSPGTTLKFRLTTLGEQMAEHLHKESK